MQDTHSSGLPSPLLDERAREQIALAADILIPGDDAMPSAREADVTGPALDAVLAARPDLLPVLARLATGTRPLNERLEDLHGTDRETFEQFVLAVSCAYGMDDRVRLSLGYPGQIAYAIADDEPQLDELLAPVRARGPVYVTTPGGVS